MYKLMAILCIGSICTIAGARCYKLIYTGYTACELAPCNVPSTPPPCNGPSVLADAPVYTTQSANPGKKRIAADYRCEVTWFTTDPDHQCTVQHTCLNFVGGFVLDQNAECFSSVE